MFRAAQAGKRSVALDLKDPDAATAVEKLLGWADIDEPVRFQFMQASWVDWKYTTALIPQC